MSKSTDHNSPKQPAKSASQPQKPAQSKTPIINAPAGNSGNKTTKNDFIPDTKPARNDPDHQIKLKKVSKDTAIPPPRTDKSGNQQEKHS